MTSGTPIKMGFQETSEIWEAPAHHKEPPKETVHQNHVFHKQQLKLKATGLTLQTIQQHIQSSELQRWRPQGFPLKCTFLSILPIQALYYRESLRKQFSWPWVNYLRLSLEDGYRPGMMLYTRALKSLSSEVHRWVRKLPWKQQVNLTNTNISPWNLPRAKGATAPAPRRLEALHVVQDTGSSEMNHCAELSLLPTPENRLTQPVLAWHQNTSQHTTIKQEKHNSTPKELERTAQTRATVTACRLSALWHASLN